MTLTSLADVAAQEFEVNNGNNTSSATIRIAASSGVSLVASGAGSVTAGGAIDYSLSVVNAGPSTAENVVAKDILPPQVDVTSFSISGGGSCSNTPGTGTVTCNAGSVASGSGRTVTVNGRVKANTAQGTVIFNDAQVSSSTDDPSNADNVDTVATTINAGTSGLTVGQVGPAGANAGSTVAYTATITNVGPDAATNTVARESAPTALTITNMTSSQGTCNPEATPIPACNLGTLAASGGSATVTVMGKIRTNTADGTVLFSSIQASSDAFESSNGDNLATTATTVTGVSSGLVVTSSGPATVVAGDTITYDFTVQNVGPDAASNVVVKNAAPSEVEITDFTIAQGDCGLTFGTLSCTLGTLASGGGPIAGSVIGKVKPGVADGTALLDSTSASGTVYESDTGDNVSTVGTTVDAQADLSIALSSSSDPVNLQTPFQWTDLVSNNGPSDAVNVTVVDTIPHLVDDLIVRKLPAQCDRFEETITCTLASLKAGATFPITIELEADVGNGPTLSHSATVSADTTEAAPGDETANLSIGLTAPDLTGSFTSITGNCVPIVGPCLVQGTFHVTNAGNKKSPQSTFKIARSDNTTLGSGDPVLGPSRSVSSTRARRRT